MLVETKIRVYNDTSFPVQIVASATPDKFTVLFSQNLTLLGGIDPKVSVTLADYKFKFIGHPPSCDMQIIYDKSTSAYHVHSSFSKWRRDSI